jgi:hypothetical protein
LTLQGSHPIDKGQNRPTNRYGAGQIPDAGQADGLTLGREPATIYWGRAIQPSEIGSHRI